MTAPVPIFRGVERSRVLELVSGAGLPTADLDAVDLSAFLGCGDPEHPDGVIGLELFGPVGLLRSLVVAESARGRGYGHALVTALEDLARAEGVETLYLLTTTVPGFFEHEGYATIARDDVPAAIKATAEFSSLCPADAVVMRKIL